LNISDEHLPLTSRITEGKRNNKNYNWLPAIAHYYTYY